MSRVRSFRFGPGAMESIELRVWMHPRSHPSHARELKARASGRYDVYCGAGWSHRVDIEEEHALQIDAAPRGDVDRDLVTAWRDGDRVAARQAADHLVEWALEDWMDPCGSELEEP